ncbi:MAG: AzlD domain-containing protein [Deltaproteobacteria bacterium]|nr:AzlD domain-containing protein [Deltaproteobacteria bacterium]
MIDKHYIVLIIGMGLVTYIPRWLPVAALSGRELPLWLRQWLDLIPAAILSALILPALLAGPTPGSLHFLQPKLLVALPTFGFALKTRSLGGTVIIGMLLYWLAEKLI